MFYFFRKKILRPTDFGIISFVFGTAVAAYSTVLPFILRDIIYYKDYIGYYYSGIALIAMIASFLSSLMFSNFGKSNVLKVNILICSFIIAVMSTGITNRFLSFMSLDIIRAVCIMIVQLTLVLFINDFINKTDLEKARSSFNFNFSLGWIVGPLAGGYIATNYGNRIIFIFTSILFLFSFFLFLRLPIHDKVINKTKKKAKKINYFKLLKIYFSKKDFLIAYLIFFGCGITGAVKGLYYPLGLKEVGFSKELIGYAMSGTSVTFVLLGSFFVRLAEKVGEKSMFIISFSLIGIFYLLFNYFTSYNRFDCYLLLALMIIGTIPIVAVVVIKDNYFFDLVKPSEKDKMFGIYNTAKPLSNVFAPIIGSFFMSLNLSDSRISSIGNLWLGFAMLFVLFIVVAMHTKTRKQRQKIRKQRKHKLTE